MAVIIAESLLSLFAVFGLYAAVRLFVTALLAPADMGVALEIREPLTLKEAEALLARARENFFLRGNGRVIALIDAALAADEELFRFLESEAVECYYTDFETDGEGG